MPFLINIRTQLAVLLGPALPVDHLPNAMGQAVACANGVFGQEAQVRTCPRLTDVALTNGPERSREA